MFQNKKDIVFVVLAGFFITNAIVAEMIGGKLIQLGPFALSIGIIPWPFVFLSTDLINEHFGKSGVRKLTMLTSALITYAFIILFLGMSVPAATFSPVSDSNFLAVFGQSMWIIIGSLTAFILSQLIDASIFWLFKSKTGDRLIWLRATGSTAISQFIDTFVVAGIAFLLPGKVSFNQYMDMSLTGYSAKLIIAILLTPLIYTGHKMINKFLSPQA